MIWYVTAEGEACGSSVGGSWSRPSTSVPPACAPASAAPSMRQAAISTIRIEVLIDDALGVLGYGRQRLVPQPAGFWRHDPRLGWHHTAGSEGVFDRSPVFRTRVRINDKGLRGRDYPYERVAGRRRILVLGDSFVFGYGVEQEEIFTTVLEGLLPATEVINAGVSGYGTDQELLWF